jgi:hypothetical protein
MSEARITSDRLDRLETDVADIKTTLRELVPIIHRIDATLPYLATKTELTSEVGKLAIELAGKPSRGYLWAVMAAMVGAQATALSAAAVILSVIR